MSSIKSIVNRRLRKLISSIYDPLIDVAVGNQHIQTPLSHSLKENISVHKELNFNLGRLVQYIGEYLPDTKVIDIGANVGDTVAYIRNFSNAPILCIDGDEKYLSVLRSNVKQYNQVEICKALVGSENKEIGAELKSERGTAFLKESAQKVSLRTLENILADFPSFAHSNFIKSDTDGYDTIILRSSERYLKAERPFLFFEFDPYLIAKNNDDALSFLEFLQSCRYRYFMFYMSNGDFLTGLDIEKERNTLAQLVHYFSGRNITLYADVCAFPDSQEQVFAQCVKRELAHYKMARSY